MSLAAIEQRTLSRYLREDNRQLRTDRKAGVADGQRSFPSQRADSYPFMEVECAKASHALENFDAEISRHIDEINDRRAKAENDRSENYVRAKDDLIERKQAQLGIVDRTIGPGSQKLRQAQGQYDEINVMYRNLQAALGRPLRVKLVYLYIPILVIFVAIEANINRLAFELFFGEGAAWNLVTAGLVGALLMFMSHYVGSWIRYLGENKNLVVLAARALGIILVTALAGALIFFIAKMRQGYAIFIEGEREAEQGLGELLRGGTIDIPVLQEVLQIPLRGDGMLLFLMNVVIFVVAVILAFARHDPHPDYEPLHTKRARAARNLAKLQQKFEQEAARVSNEFDEKIGNINRQIDDQEKDIASYDAQIAAAEQAKISDKVRVARHVAARLWEYQAGNMASRPQGDVPACFEAWNDESLLRKLLGTGADDNVIRHFKAAASPVAER